jgi:hypothetical protein
MEFVKEYSLLKTILEMAKIRPQKTFHWDIGRQIFASAFSFWRDFAIFRQRNWENKFCKILIF